MKLTSSAFANGQAIPAHYTCDGDNLSPELQWSDAPDGTVSLALTCEDPDAPSGTFTHWVMWNVEPVQEGIGAGKVPTGTRQGRNDFGEIGYGGPCPPPGHGTHHYHFNLYAVLKEISLPDGATIADLRNELEGAILGQAELVGTYER